MRHAPEKSSTPSSFISSRARRHSFWERSHSSNRCPTSLRSCSSSCVIRSDAAARMSAASKLGACSSRILLSGSERSEPLSASLVSRVRC
jgi:hypothetical protein